MLDAIRPELRQLDPGSVVLISSQVPVGTCTASKPNSRALRFAVSPENIRVKTGAADFRNQARVIVGTRHEELRPRFEALFAPFTDTVIFMSPESAEMTKHTLNGYLALCIVYINEIAAVCKQVRADTGASSIVSNRSSTRVRSSLSKSITGSAGVRSTGSPNSRIGCTATGGSPGLAGRRDPARAIGRADGAAPGGLAIGAPV